LEHRYNKEKTEKENAIKEKELLQNFNQKQLDDMKAQLELAKAAPGDVVQIFRILKSWEKALCSMPGCTQARKSSTIFSVRGNCILLCTLPLHNAFHSILCSSIAICVVLLPLIANSGQSLLINHDLHGPFARRPGGGGICPKLDTKC
jgi:hypothetical protein